MNTLLFYRVVSLLATRLPRHAGYALARPVSGVAYRYNHAVRDAVAANLRFVLDGRGRPWSEAELQPLVRRNFDNFGKYVVDFFSLGSLAPESLDPLIRAEHVEYLEQCQALGKGIIGLTAHIGNWELGASVMQRHGCRVNAVVRPQASPKLDALFASPRNKRGIQALPMSGAARAVPACLKRNELVALLADFDFSARKRRAPFFGRPAPLPWGASVLAKRTGAPILPAFVLRRDDDTFCFRAYPPILPDPARSIADIQQCICAVLEDVIGGHPDQWFAFEPMWGGRCADAQCQPIRPAYDDGDPCP